MDNETEKYLNQLKELRLELYRCAANLDCDIKLIENNMVPASIEIDGVERPMYNNPIPLINKLYKVRKRRWYRIFRHEENAFEKLINSLKSENFGG